MRRVDPAGKRFWPPAAAVLFAARAALGASGEDFGETARRLIDPSPEKRREAEGKLLAAGPDALPAVAEAALSDHWQAASRARRILARWDWPTPELVAKIRSCPARTAARILAEGLTRPAPIEMDTLKADLLPCEKHLRWQEGCFAAIEALAALPQEEAMAALAETLEDPDLPKYFTLRAIGRLGGSRATTLLGRFTQENSTLGWVAIPELARLGTPEPLEAALARSAKHIERAKARRRDSSVPLYNHACLLVLAGRGREAAPYLDESLQAGQLNAAWALIDPDFDSVRKEPWFRDLLAKHGTGFPAENPKEPK